MLLKMSAESKHCLRRYECIIETTVGNFAAKAHLQGDSQLTHLLYVGQQCINAITLERYQDLPVGVVKTRSIIGLAEGNSAVAAQFLYRKSFQRHVQPFVALFR